MATPGLFQLLADPEGYRQAQQFQLQELLVNPSQVQQPGYVTFMQPAQKQADQGSGETLPQIPATPLQGEAAAATGAGVGVLSPEELEIGRNNLGQMQESVGVPSDPINSLQGLGLTDILGGL